MPARHSKPQAPYFAMPIKSIILIIICAATPVWAGDTIQSCFDKANTQLEINQCGGLDQQIVDQALNTVYQAVLTKHATNQLFVQKLKLAQRAWITWRDAEMAAIYPETHDPGFYGSSFAGCWNGQLARITRERTLQLRKWLDGVEEGDICSGSYPIKQMPK